ncbi:hypothetical protein BDW22DRAFT_1350366 [Trametopsis cervina]|nr:hypothetical protein BDW22DRAFT_1350366 [Trametopsis cervina]
MDGGRVQVAEGVDDSALIVFAGPPTISGLGLLPFVDQLTNKYTPIDRHPSPRTEPYVSLPWPGEPLGNRLLDWHKRTQKDSRLARLQASEQDHDSGCAPASFVDTAAAACILLDLQGNVQPAARTLPELSGKYTHYLVRADGVLRRATV